MAEITANEKLVQVADLVNFAVKNDTLYPRKAAVTAEIDEKVASQISAVYRPAGDAASVDDLPELTKENIGKVVNLKADIQTTEDFVEGAGATISAGTDVAVVEGADEGTYLYNALAGTVNMTAYAKTEAVAEDLAKKVDKLEGMGLSSNDYTTAEKTKLESLEVASSAEVAAAIDTALGLNAGGSEEDENGGGEDEPEGE